MKRRQVYLAAVSLAGAMTAVACAVAAPGDAITDLAKAGPDYALQGEYAGRAGGEKLGAQVIAMGNGTFQAVFLPGGLPGEGWDGKTRVRIDGKTEGTDTHFEKEGQPWRACILKPNVLEGANDKGMEFKLEKVERKSPTLGLKAPAGAVALFDGSSADAWAGGKISEDGFLQVGTRTKQSFGDIKHLHFEFRTPFQPGARGQGRGNSGLYLQDRWEIQILDSFGLNGENNECGGLYGQKKPDVNMCFPPLSWQTYDVEFEGVKVDAAGQKVKNAVVTVRHNGVVIHDKVELKGDDPKPGPLQIQNHGNPVVVRNVWVLEKK
jgi:3-keto-disaccharide hydrolase